MFLKLPLFLLAGALLNVQCALISGTSPNTTAATDISHSKLSVLPSINSEVAVSPANHENIQNIKNNSITTKTSSSTSVSSSSLFLSTISNSHQPVLFTRQEEQIAQTSSLPQNSNSTTSTFSSNSTKISTNILPTASPVKTPSTESPSTEGVKLENTFEDKFNIFLQEASKLIIKFAGATDIIYSAL
jgi:hypothetical protein